ncbi:MAG: FAD-dependent oxidoreductase [Rhodopirellula sp.]|nr:FAD-dependent oxidoreductase [Rhodopirellula sp.]
MRAVSLLVVFLFSAAGQAAEPTYDVVVYGGTSGGVAAAVQAARMGKSVVLIEPGRHLGGLSSGGLGATDIGNKAAIGGISREFYQRIFRHYQQPSAWEQETREEYATRKKGRSIDGDTMWGFEPHVAEQVFEAMIREAAVPVVRDERLDRSGGVKKEGSKIAAIVMESGKTYRGKMFIDAGYEGDLMAAAGVSYAVGRESNDQYGETLNGVQTVRAIFHQFVKPVDPYVRPGDPSSGMLPGVHAGSPGEEGAGDRRVQAYCYRMCTTDVPENRVDWPKPAGYDPSRYELLLRNFEAGDERIPWAPSAMPNRKTDTNNNFAISTDNIGMNYDYPDGDYATRRRILDEHESYQKGLMWTLANSPRVPEKVRKEFQTWGLAKNEFTDNGNWPHQLYVREARRMIGEYVMTEHNCRWQKTAEDPIGLGAYGMDSHHVQRYVDETGHARNEGDVEVGVAGPYPISFRSIVPRAGECSNLLVPVCLSASHIAYGSIRMEPVFMILGQSAATAASQAIDAGKAIQAIDYAGLRERLLADRQVLEWTAPASQAALMLDPKKLAGVTVDDQQAVLTGAWGTSQAIGPYVGTGYRHDIDEDKGAKSARFEARLPESGRYTVRLAYSPSANRATNVLVKVHAVDGTKTVVVNQRKQPTEDKAFVSIGTFRFAADQPAAVVISNEAADGYVILDAVQFLPEK